jgi:hypothetical protein
LFAAENNASQLVTGLHSDSNIARTRAQYSQVPHDGVGRTLQIFRIWARCRSVGQLVSDIAQLAYERLAIPRQLSHRCQFIPVSSQHPDKRRKIKRIQTNNLPLVGMLLLRHGQHVKHACLPPRLATHRIQVLREKGERLGLSQIEQLSNIRRLRLHSHPLS